MAEAKSEPPKFIIPDETPHKFIQAYVNNEPYFRHDNGKEVSPMTLLRKLLFEFDMNVIGAGIIPERGMNYRRVGGGQMEEISQGIYDLKRTSADRPNQRHLNDLTPYLPEGIELNIPKRAA